MTTAPGASMPANRPAPQVAPILFVGGTGRSGTHIVARLLGRSMSLVNIPVECRFHVEDRGFPGLLAGRVSKRSFLRRLNGFWWRGRQRGRWRGMYRLMERERFDTAVAAFDERFDADPEGACRALFLDLLWPLAAAARRASGIVEQSCDVVAAAPTLVRLFPEARFVHVVRDGRDASASRVAQTRLSYPRTRREGLEWWERRIRAIDAGARAIPDGRLLEVRLERLLEQPDGPDVRRLAEHAGITAGARVRRFARRRMSAEAANKDRWRQGISPRRAARIEREYEELLARLEADGVSCAPLLRDDDGARA